MSAQKTTDTSDKLKGSIKEAIGKLVGDPEVEAEGKSQRDSPTSDAKPKPTLTKTTPTKTTPTKTTPTKTTLTKTTSSKTTPTKTTPEP